MIWQIKQIIPWYYRYSPSALVPNARTQVRSHNNLLLVTFWFVRAFVEVSKLSVRQSSASIVRLFITYLVAQRSAKVESSECSPPSPRNRRDPFFQTFDLLFGLFALYIEFYEKNRVVFLFGCIWHVRQNHRDIMRACVHRSHAPHVLCTLAASSSSTSSLSTSHVALFAVRCVECILKSCPPNDV